MYPQLTPSKLLPRTPSLRLCEKAPPGGRLAASLDMLPACEINRCKNVRTMGENGGENRQPSHKFKQSNSKIKELERKKKMGSANNL